jgi:hypothetical protein
VRSKRARGKEGERQARSSRRPAIVCLAFSAHSLVAAGIMVDREDDLRRTGEPFHEDDCSADNPEVQFVSTPPSPAEGSQSHLEIPPRTNPRTRSSRSLQQATGELSANLGRSLHSATAKRCAPMTAYLHGHFCGLQSRKSGRHRASRPLLRSRCVGVWLRPEMWLPFRFRNFNSKGPDEKTRGRFPGRGLP